MNNNPPLNLICAGFPRCGTTHLTRYIEKFTNIKVLKDPISGGYELNALGQETMNEYYIKELAEEIDIFHKFSGYSYMRAVYSTINRIIIDRPNTSVIIMLGDPYDRLQSWHGFHKSKALRGDDPSHFTYKERDFYSNCSITEYYHRFAHDKLEYKLILDKLLECTGKENLNIIRQSDLRSYPEHVLAILSVKMGFDLKPIAEPIESDPTLFETGVSIEESAELREKLGDLYLNTTVWAKANEILIDLESHKDDSRVVEYVNTCKNQEPFSFKPLKFSSYNSEGSSVLVIGNGPSASLVDFDYLKSNNIITCGMNSAYRLWDKIDFRPNYYICMDSVVIKSHAPAIKKLIEEGRIHKFFLRNEFLELYPEHADTQSITWFNGIQDQNHPFFQTYYITTGSWALRWMKYLGHKLIGVIGVDANYQEILKEATRTGDYELAISQTPKYNPNYFFDGYQQTGDAYNIPNDPQYVRDHGTTVHADAVVNVKDDLNKLNIRSSILDLSPLSAHNAFPKTSIVDFLNFLNRVETQKISLTTSFFYREGNEEDTLLNTKALCFNLKQSKIYRINLLFEGDIDAYISILDDDTVTFLRQCMASGKLNVVSISTRPSYYTLFNVAKGTGVHFSLVSNSDLIYSDTTIDEIIYSHALQFPNTVYCLTRWNKTTHGMFLQGQVPAPPWQEMAIEDMTELSDVNYLSYDTYVFTSKIAVPTELEKVLIGTFGCDTAIAAILRCNGFIVINPCLDIKALHIDNKPRNYSSDSGQLQVLANVEAFKLSLKNAFHKHSRSDSTFKILEQVKPSSLSIGTPMHGSGWWYSLFRLFGASPWVYSTEFSNIEFEKFELDPRTFVLQEKDILVRLEQAMQAGKFLEICISGSNGNHYLGSFNTDNFKVVKMMLFRYDRQYVMFEDDLDENIRREFDRLMIFIKDRLNQRREESSLYIYDHLGESNKDNTNDSKHEESIKDEILESFNAQHMKQGKSNLHLDSIQTDLEKIRLLIVDPTPIGSNSATGQIKNTFFGHLRDQNILQVWEYVGKNPGLRLFTPSIDVDPNVDSGIRQESDLIDSIKFFDPHIVYFRSTASEVLHKFHHLVLKTFQIPSILHIMDDWESRLIYEGNSSHSILSPLLRESISLSQTKLTICTKMSEVFTRKYGGHWIPLANGADCGNVRKNSSGKIDHANQNQKDTITIKYMGGLAEDMNAESIIDLARGVEQLHNEGISVSFEISTMDWYMQWAETKLSGFSSVKLKGLVPFEYYMDEMNSADILIIAYNFDPKSIAYTRLSMANKLPEILATGNMLFAYGPVDIATIEHIKNEDLGVVVVEKNLTALKNALKDAVVNQSTRQHYGLKGYSYAKRYMSIRNVRHKVNALIIHTIRKTSR